MHCAAGERVSLNTSTLRAEVRDHFAGLMYGLKPVPFQRTHYLRLSVREGG